jgi:hypothetical protein
MDTFESELAALRNRTFAATADLRILERLHMDLSHPSLTRSAD